MHYVGVLVPFLRLELLFGRDGEKAQSGEDELSRKTRLSLNLHLLRPHHCPTISSRSPIALIRALFCAREALSVYFRLRSTIFHPRSPSHSRNGQAHLHDRHPDQAPQRSAGALHSLILLFRFLDGKAGCLRDIAKMEIIMLKRETEGLIFFSNRAMS